ncbi:hypothetical protein ERJ75_000442400 [Trypanosoma vivax]|nr:hypothetical protein ERJ75_000442400 [Trypanosoma vivax]
MYRDWLYGDERRYVNYVGVVLGVVSISLFFYTMRVMGNETWDIPAPMLAAQRRKALANVSAKDEVGTNVALVALKVVLG